MSEICEFSRDFSVRVNSPEGDPFWTHASACPDCQALLNAYHEFKTPADDAELPFDLDKADEELAARLDSALELPIQPAALKKSPLGFPHWWVRKEFWYSTAAILVVGAGLFLGQDLRTLSEPGFGGDSGLVRGEDSTADQFLCIRENGTLLVTWPQQPDADLIRIILFDEAMIELGNFTSPVAGPLLISESPLVGKAIYGQVFYLAQDDVLHRGPLFPIPAAP